MNPKELKFIGGNLFVDYLIKLPRTNQMKETIKFEERWCADGELETIIETIERKEVEATVFSHSFQSVLEPPVECVGSLQFTRSLKTTNISYQK